MLYDSVQAAEEVDLQEQVQAERAWAEMHALNDWPPDEVDMTVDSADNTQPAAEDRITMSQAVGIVEHLLGGQSMP